MGRLEEWYGVEGARRVRAQHRRRRLSRYEGPFDVKPATGYTTTGAVGSAELTAARRQLESDMKRVIAQLRSAALDVIKRLDSWTNKALYSYETRVAYARSIATILNSTIPARERSMQDVLDGKLAPEKWLQACNFVADGISDIYRGMGEDTVFAQFSAVFRGVAGDFTAIATTFADITRALGKLAQDVPKKIDEYGGLLMLGGLGILAFIAYQYATAPLRLLPSGPVNGYKGASTHRRRR